MKRIGKSKSFQMRRSNNNPTTTSNERPGRRELSMDRRVVRSYDAVAVSDSDSDQEDHGCMKTMEADDSSESGWASMAAASMGLPNLLWTSAPPTPSKMSFKTPLRTGSKFKPSYLLQKRKDALAQHAHVLHLPEQHSRKHSVGALLFLLLALYLLASLSHVQIPHPFQTQQQPTQTTKFYLNLKEDRPLAIVSKMMRLHAYAYQQKQPTQFVGVCGYPTYQSESQRQATELLQQMGLQDTLSFDVCPPLEAVLHRDPHYVLWEEVDLPVVDLKRNLAWQAAIAIQAQPTPQDTSEVWRQVLNWGDSTTTTTTLSQTKRRLRGTLEEVGEFVP